MNFENSPLLLEICSISTEEHNNLVIEISNFINSKKPSSSLHSVPKWMLEAFKYVSANAKSDTKFTRRNICDIHKLLSLEGKFRTKEFESTCVHFGADYPYFPPDADEIPALMDKYEKWYLTLKREKSLKFICEAYYVYELIHPFNDGNGRTGRLICAWLMIRNGYEYFAPLLEKTWGANSEHRIRIFNSINNNYLGCLGNPEILNDHFRKFYSYFLAELRNLLDIKSDSKNS